MNQLVSRINSERLAVGPTLGEVISIPYNSATLEEPVFVNLYCYGFTTVSSNVQRFMFVLPIIYYSKTTNYFSIPTDGDTFDYLSTNFTHIEYADAGDLSTFLFAVYPQASSGGLSVHVSPPDTGTDWDIFCYADIYKQI